ncbi:MAG: glucose 1-dehydrogenase [Acidobacteria bacterium]|nr:glucose 1-dehydrogenase [Acidobacteriota bacterium]
MYTIDLSGRNAVVTGASSGIGAAIARALSKAGARVAVMARRKDRLDALAAELGPSALSIACDVAQRESVAAAMAEAWDTMGRVDILVTAAGVAADGGPVPEKIVYDAFAQTMQVNVTGLWQCCQEIGARMLADGKGGSIINIASIAGVNGWPGGPTGYQASKGAVIQITRNLAASWGDRGIRVNAIAPGWFPSEMTESLMKDPNYVAFMKNGAPLRRIGELRDLEGPAILLASDAGAFITGQILTVDGGTTASGFGEEPESFRSFLANAIPGGLGKPIGK